MMGVWRWGGERRGRADGDVNIDGRSVEVRMERGGRADV